LTIVLHALAGVDPPIPVRVSGDADVLEAARARLPDGAAAPEAIAARARRAGADVTWGAPDPAPSRDALLELCRARGASSVEIVRADPGLLSRLQLGTFFDASIRRRSARRAALALRIVREPDVAFWDGVRSAATPAEWRRLTRSSYVVLYYHRVAEPKAGQERLAVAPERFERQMRWLRRLRLRPLSVDELIGFHSDPAATLPPRAVVLCADDAFVDAVAALRRHVELRPIVFVPTGAVGRPAPWDWADGEPIASWQELRELVSAGGSVGSHARSHTPLPELDETALAAELEESLVELRRHVPGAAPLLAYPHGEHDAAVRAAAERTGYAAAFTTRAGRNGAGTDRYALRRIEPKGWNGAAGLAWKALTGDGVPWALERLRRRVRTLR